MKTLSKKVEYKGYSFNVNVALFNKNERHIGGKRFHTVMVSHLGSANWAETFDVEHTNVDNILSLAEGRARAWVDQREHTLSTPEREAEAVLIGLGFERTSGIEL